MMTKTTIPAGWKYSSLGGIASFRNGKGHEKYIVENGQYIVVNSKFVSSNGRIKKFSNHELSPLHENDVVMVMSDVPNGKAIAKCFLVPVASKYSLNQRICAINSDTIIGAFLYRILDRNRYLLLFDDGVKQTNLRKDEILDCPLIYPPLLEQEKIVEVLETWDGYIEKLSRAIKLKKKVKKGLMQKLLMGKMRLKEFSDPWVYMKLEDLADTKSGGTPESTRSDYYLNGNIPWLKSGEVRKGFITHFSNYITKAGLENSSAKIFPINTILVAMYGVTAGQIGFLLKEASTNQAICGVLPNQKYSSIYLYYFLLTQTDKLLKMGSGAAQPNISQNIIKNYDIYIPKNLKEQTAIAQILTAADQEIEALEKKKVIIEQQKKFLLNNMITGKIRLPEFIHHFVNVNKMV